MQQCCTIQREVLSSADGKLFSAFTWYFNVRQTDFLARLQAEFDHVWVYTLNMNHLVRYYLCLVLRDWICLFAGRVGSGPVLERLYIWTMVLSFCWK